MDRRDVLKMMAAAPMAGMFGGAAAAADLEAADVVRFTTPNQGVRRSVPASSMWREFTGPFTRQVAFPLGGIGTGSVSLGGRGELRDWEIANHSDKGRILANTFFALWYRDDRGAGRACILESQVQPPYPGWMGFSRDGMPGMPRFKDGKFLGAYPFARLELFDREIPLGATLEAFNPFIPLNEKDSGLPVAIFYWRIKNRTGRRMPVTVLLAMQNIAGDKSFGKNQNSFADEDGLRGIKMTSEKHAPEKPQYGDLAIVTNHADVTHQTRWARQGWFDDQSLFWNDFADDGRLENKFEQKPTHDNQTDTGCLGLVAELASGEERIFPFVVAWNFPNRENRWNSEKEVKGKILKNHYSTWLPNAWDAARYTFANLERLENETREFQRALFSSTLPAPVLDAISSQASTLKTNVCFRTDDGNFYGFEGATDDNGCCPLNCSHVWNYEQSLAYLFPALERTMRNVDFGHNTLPEGNMSFRTLLPLGEYWWAKDMPAADGQMGTVVKLYREWRLSGDTEWLRSLWPEAKRALEYAWKRWDKDKDGVMEDIQHNTYDIEFHGPNSMMGTIYLTALLAGERMARAMGDEAAAQDYRAVYENGRRRLAELCWNGEFFIQKNEKATEMKYQLGEGCLSDQMLGQWMAHVVGLGHVVPPEQARGAIRAVYKHNFKPTLAGHYNPQRIYALGDEGGLLLASWPNGARPPLPFVYSDEVWTGIEYQVAAHMIYEGFIEEGLRIVEAVRNRHDGERRNPWDEIECGHHYARAMASWSLLLALSGHQYDGVARRMEFAPVFRANDFKCFWSCGSGWGTYRQAMGERRIDARLDVLYGELSLNELRIPAPRHAVVGHEASVSAEINGERVYPKFAREGGAMAVQFKDASISRGERIEAAVWA